MERGDYEIKREAYNQELIERTLAIQALQAIDMPYLVEDED